MIPAAAWIAGLTIAAYMLAQTAAVIIRGNFDDALRNAPPVAHNRTEREPSSLTLSNVSDGNKAACVPKTAAGRGVKVERISDVQWILDRGSLLANTRDLNRFLMQARAVPYKEQGRIAGFRILWISPGSLYEKIGLRRGDVLHRVNNRKLDDPAKLLSLYQEMRTKRHISILLARNGQEQTFHYDVR
jgi:S1-C subfamily serine protease